MYTLVNKNVASAPIYGYVCGEPQAIYQEKWLMMDTAYHRQDLFMTATASYRGICNLY